MQKRIGKNALSLLLSLLVATVLMSTMALAADTPRAEVTSLSNLQIAEGVKLDVGYEMKTTEDENATYGDWKADFYVKANKPVPAGAITLWGNYGEYGWVAFKADETIPAGTSIALVETAFDQNFTYNDVLIFVKDFKCGAVGSAEAAGITMTVELKLTKDGDTLNIGSWNYTFPTKVQTVEVPNNVITVEGGTPAVNVQNQIVAAMQSVSAPAATAGQLATAAQKLDLGDASLTIKAELESTDVHVASANSTPVATKYTFDVEPYKGGFSIAPQWNALNDASRPSVTFRLPLPFFQDDVAQVTHGEDKFLVPVKGTDANKYIDVTTDHFSTFEVDGATIYIEEGANLGGGNYFPAAQYSESQATMRFVWTVLCSVDVNNCGAYFVQWDNFNAFKNGTVNGLKATPINESGLTHGYGEWFYIQADLKDVPRAISVHAVPFVNGMAISNAAISIKVAD